MTDREALAAALEDFDQWPDPDSAEPWEMVMTAARERLAQLAEKCEVCDGSELICVGEPHEHDDGCRCPAPVADHGKVYSAGLLQRIVDVLNEGEPDPIFEGELLAVAVLDALNGETG